MQRTLIFLFLSIFLAVNAQEKSIVKISGFAPDFIGKTVSLSHIDDYITMHETPFANTIVKGDSTFELVFFGNQTEKIILRADKNSSFMYLQPNGSYKVYVPLKDEYEPFRPAGNEVELTFFDLDSNDINYKILMFNRWMDEVVSTYFHLKQTQPVKFNEKIDEFKTNAEKYYASDTSMYLKMYIKYSFASLDNIQQAGERNRYEKHDFYLKHTPVQYHNDAYMDYFKGFYSKMLPRLSMEANNRVYLGVLKSSPSMIMKALGMDYTMINLRIREMAMISILGEAYHSDDFPQTNILTILDSLSEKCLFEANRPIAINMRERLTQLVPGGEAPLTLLKLNSGENRLLTDYKGKFVYLHFFNPGSEKSVIELPVLKLLHDKYNQEITFISVCQNKSFDSKELNLLKSIPWDVAVMDEDNAIWKNYQIKTFPQYVLLDAETSIVQAPALGPQPDGDRETIDFTFFNIKKIQDQFRK